MSHLSLQCSGWWFSSSLIFSLFSVFLWGWEWWLLRSLYVKAETRNSQRHFLNPEVGNLSPVLLTALSLNMLIHYTFQIKSLLLRIGVLMSTWFSLWICKYLMHIIYRKNTNNKLWVPLQHVGNLLNVGYKFHEDKYFCLFYLSLSFQSIGLYSTCIKFSVNICWINSHSKEIQDDDLSIGKRKWFIPRSGNSGKNLTYFQLSGHNPPKVDPFNPLFFFTLHSYIIL